MAPRDSQGVETAQCPHPDCDREFEDFNSVSTFIEAGDHADYDHGDDVRWVRTSDGWVLRYDPEEAVA